MEKTVSDWEKHLNNQIKECLKSGSTMDLFCTECMIVKDILEDNDGFSKKEIDEYFSLEASDQLNKKIENVFGMNSIINKAFKRVTSNDIEYRNIVKDDFGNKFLNKLELNSKI